VEHKRRIDRVREEKELATTAMVAKQRLRTARLVGVLSDALKFGYFSDKERQEIKERIHQFTQGQPLRLAVDGGRHRL
jgi:hypothetical protein